VTAGFIHAPVLLTETIHALRPEPGGRFIDATVGAGGHAEKVLELSSPDGALLGIDADPAALRATSLRLAPFGARVSLVESYFDGLAAVAPPAGFTEVDGILFDLGVSSPQLDFPERGFSFQTDGPLDMRLGPSAGQTAADLVNTLTADELQRIFQEYGEERNSRRVAQRIVEERKSRAIRTTAELSRVVAQAKPSTPRERIHPATRVFQALRIAVNDELGRIERALPQAISLLRAGGHIAVISFHSLEDRIVKQFIRREGRDCLCPPSVPVCVCGHVASLRPLTSRPITASQSEIATNPRARSAKLRAAIRLESRPSLAGHARPAPHESRMTMHKGGTC
jgi:16S rRNA (cytosine1402-N4)-methyltransferase